MVQKMPINNFRWTDPNVWTCDNILRYDPDGDEGHFLEVDVAIPNRLHNKFNDYPLFPESVHIINDMASPMSLKIRERRYEGIRKVPSTFSVKKLAPNLLPKSKYIVHIRNLQFYLEEGVELLKVHRVLSFHQVNMS